MQTNYRHFVRAGIKFRAAGSWPVLLVMCLACIDPYAPEILAADYGVLVIDGFFVPNDTTRIRLSRTVILDEQGQIAPEPMAEVKIESDNGLELTLSPKGDHLYIAPPVIVDNNAQYRLTVRTADGRQYASQFVPLKTRTSVDSVVIHQKENSQQVSFNVFSHDVRNGSRYYSFQFDETWEYVSVRNSVFKYENDQVLPRVRSDELRTCWRTRPSQDIRVVATEKLSEDVVYDFPVLEMRLSDRRLYAAYSMNVRQYVLTPDAYSYWSIIKKNSQELGTLFDPIPAQPAGNYSCLNEANRPVVGYFSAAEVSTCRQFVKRSDLRAPNEPYTSDGYEDCTESVVPVEEVSAITMYGMLISEGIYEDVTSRLSAYKIFPAYCLDCRLQGGTNVRPNYWH